MENYEEFADANANHNDEEDEFMESMEEDHLSHADHKENGNVAYKAKDYRGAILHYTLAIETAAPSTSLDDINNNDDNGSGIDKNILATYYNNRAAASTMILQYEDAVQDCDTILSFNPTFIKAFIRKAKVLTFTGQLNEANDIYKQALTILNDSENDNAVRLQRAESTISTSSVNTNASTASTANVAKEKANIASLQRDLQTLLQRVTLIQSLLQIKDNNDQGAAASSSSSTSSDLKQLIPLLTISKRNASQALKQINLILKSCPNYKSLLPYKLQSYILTEQYDDAYALSSSLLRTLGNDCMILYYRSYILYQRGLLPETLKHLKQILKNDPDHKLSQKLFKALRSLSQQKDLGDEEYKKASYEKASEYYTNAIDNKICVGLYKSKLYYNRSCALFNLKLYPECIKDCNLALQIDDEYVKVYTKRANANINLVECTERDCMSAIQDFEKAIELVERSSASSGGANEAADKKQIKEFQKNIHETKIQIKRLKQKDFYKILGVSRSANQKEVKKSYHKMAMKYHPDKQKNKTEEERDKAEVIFKDVNLAYEVLSDEEKKAKYDSGVEVEDLDNPHAGHGHGHSHGGFGGGHGGMDPSVIFEAFMRQQQGGGGRGGGGFHFG